VRPPLWPLIWTWATSATGRGGDGRADAYPHRHRPIGHGATPHRGWTHPGDGPGYQPDSGVPGQQIDAGRQGPHLGRIQGGNRFNILADEVVLEGSLRYLQESVRQEVLTGLRRQFAGLAQATGAGINLTVEPLFPCSRTIPPSRTRQCRAPGPAGGQTPQLLHPAMGARLPLLCRRAPGFYFFLGFAPRRPGQALHSSHFNPTKQPCPAASQPLRGCWPASANRSFLPGDHGPGAPGERPGVM